jgi:hypothetical protein
VRNRVESAQQGRTPAKHEEEKDDKNKKTTRKKKKAQEAQKNTSGLWCPAQSAGFFFLPGQSGL